ncbi:type IV pilin N-terminal domain-containing protein [Halobellus ordinarius]|uniref:type IV pilin N-terminal domain-containing protein n=1 Tax=Halobellus ordinarius TaxID=3075120 RepID=UPI00288009C9|nr:type IV pilin N-terminal domain-containing protein [Halobellus sp. ZY16]
MNVRKLLTDERAVSPVVGVALLIAITVILAAVIGGVVLGLGTSSAEAPQASLQFESDGSYLLISHEGGDELKSDNVVVRGDATPAFDTDLAAGESLNKTSVTLNASEEVSVVWQDPNSNDEAVIGTFEYSG